MRPGIAALVLSLGLLGPADADAARVAGRIAPVPAAATDAAPAAGWGPFTFGITPEAAQRAARLAHARLAAAGRQDAAGRTVMAYRGPRRGEHALLEFEAGRLARVVVPLLREAAPDPAACRALHVAAAARLQAEAGLAALLASATVGDDAAPGAPSGDDAAVSDEGEEPAATVGDGDAQGWAAELRLHGTPVRVTVETAWESPEAAMDAGGDDTCISVATHRPR